MVHLTLPLLVLLENMFELLSHLADSRYGPGGWLGWHSGAEILSGGRVVFTARFALENRLYWPFICILGLFFHRVFLVDVHESGGGLVLLRTTITLIQICQKLLREPSIPILVRLKSLSLSREDAHLGHLLDLILRQSELLEIVKFETPFDFLVQLVQLALLFQFLVF